MKLCQRCSRPMEEGFVVDQTDYNAPAPAAWHRGTPDKRWWGYKTRKADKLPIRSYRCTGCGLLENYAG